ncbi:MAG TPA: hypothetical protein PL093_00105 [Candidatus Pacearchaeota archaeon]|nr:hypothetical protein [Candidatus Pacearchaeota archaeon]HQG09289.1 hypothetical protein [Candidatus Pacearchaeota archaeon]HQH19966.1 hypothetical protein [Candidatus Pacearchaeota archaeon]HQK58430.1 hypothetical protein [Candidatus Pacearchaeota archaeon]
MKIIVMYDWDGTLVDTMPAHAALAAKCIKQTFGLPYAEAKEKYLESTGVPFDLQLEKIFPLAESALKKQCADRYHREKMFLVYGDPVTFPGAFGTIKETANVFPSAIQVVSSSTEEPCIKEWARKSKLSRYFYYILGRESGNKQQHIQKLRQEFSRSVIFFISDSAEDMALPADCCVGVQASKESFQKFLDRGAYRVFSGPINFENIWETIKEYLSLPEKYIKATKK